MIIETGKNEKDLEAAVLLIRKTFGYNPSFFNEAYLTADPDFSLKDLVLGRDKQDHLVGVIRIQSKILLRNKKKYRSAGINFVCIDEKYRGKKLSRPLMLFALNEIKERGFDLSYVIARKAVDNYYNKFGYWGASSYQKLQIKGIKSDKDSHLAIRNLFEQDYIDVYKKSYDESYALCFGRSLREDAHWMYFLKLIRSMKHVNFNTIIYKKEPIGYFIESNNIILELALVNEFLNEVTLTKMDFCFSDNLVIEIPFDHSVIPYLAQMDVTYSSRRCLNGGHMLKMMGDDSERNLCFEEFQDKLKINVGLPKYNKPSCYFNISFLDQW